MRFYDAFSGIGGFHEGIRQAHPDWQCAGACEIDKRVSSVYKRHFKEVNLDEDIRKVEELPKHTDIVCGGFPCQDISTAGKRKGLGGARSGLFYEILRLASISSPKHIFLENVEGLLSSGEGWDFARILIALEEIGYAPQWAVLNTIDLLPQNRARTFIVATLGKERPPPIFPIGEADAKSDESGDENACEQTAYSLKARSYANWDGNYVLGHSRDRTGKEINYHAKRVFGTLKGQTGNQQDYLMLHDGNTKGYSIAEEGDGINLAFAADKKKGRGRVLKGKSPALQVQGAMGVVVRTRYDSENAHEDVPQADRIYGVNGLVPPLNLQWQPKIILPGQLKIRRLMPIECERLQGFPDGWTKYYENGDLVSDSQRYRMLGNAVTVPVIRAIAERF